MTKKEKETQEAEVTDTLVEVSQSSLVMVCRIIAAATERGTIKAEEMSVVGQVYDYLRTFLPAPPEAEAPAGDNAAQAKEETPEPALAE